MLPFVNNFLGSTFMNPADDVNPDIKKGDTTWFLKKAQYVYSQYVSDFCAIKYSSLEDMRESRLYSDALNSIEKYKDTLCPRTVKKGKVSDKRKGLYNISWDMFAIYPKFRKKISGLFDEIDYYPCATAVDELSDSKKQGMMYSLWAEKQEADFLAAFDAITGAKSQQPSPNIPIQPQSIEELHMLASMGAFKLNEEIEMEKLINWSLNLSGRKEIKKKLIRDFVDYGKAVIKDYTDKVSGRAMVRYVNPMYAILNYTKENEDDQLTEAGEIKFYSIATLKDYGLNDEQLIKIARNYNGQIGNKSFAWQTGYNESYNAPIFNPMKCAILDMEFESVDTKVYKIINSRGMDVAELDDDPKRTAKREEKGQLTTKKDANKRWYRCKWVIGTDIIFDYGYQYDVPYTHDDKPRSSFTMYEVDKRSITDTAKAIIDDIQIIILKLRNAEAEAAPSGLKIEWGSLSEIALGGDSGTLQPLELMKLRRQSGDIVFKYARDKNGQIIQGANNPIEELKGGIGPLLNELLLSYNEKINQLRMVTGINDIVDGSAPNPNMPVKTSEIARASTNDILKPILSGYQEIQRQVASNLALRWQHIVRFGGKDKVEGFTQAIGEAGMEIIKLSTDVSTTTMGITFDALIDDNFKDRIENAAMESMRAAKNNMPGITLNDYFIIMRCLQTGQLKFAEVYLAYREQQEQQMQSQTAQQNSQMQSEGLIKAEKAKTERELQIIAAKAKAKMDEIKLQGEIDIKVKWGIGTPWQVAPSVDGSVAPPTEPQPGSMPPQQPQVQPASA